VVVYERADRIGGLLRYGIPEFKMEKSVLDRRLAQMRAEGTEFRRNVNVGVDVSGEDLRSQYDAVVIATGATQARDLPVPGRELSGIHQAMEYLPWANRAQEGDMAVDDVPITAEGKKVLIIGGGDTGADCLGTSHRQGAESVHQFEIMPKPPDERPPANPWPTWPFTYKVTSAHEEGGERVYAVNTTEFVGNDAGEVRAVRFVEVEQKMVDGRPSFEAIGGSERELEVDLVLLAMGFTGPERHGLLEEFDVELDARGNVLRSDDWESTVPGVFVAGDAGRGQSLIVWAIAEGRSCAAAVDRHLMGETDLPSPVAPTDRPLT
jgi:glutamate synthase (NADPH/NADH) small chain